MISRRFHLIIALWLLLSVVIAALMHSSAVLQWVWGRVESLSHGMVTAERVEGVLAGPISITGLTIKTPRSDVVLPQARLDWYPGRLLVGRFSLIDVSSDAVIVTVHPGEGDSSPSTFTGLSTPLHASAGHVQVKELLIRRPGADELRFENIEVEDLDWHGEQVWVDHLSLDTPVGNVSGHGRLSSRLDGEVDFHNKAALAGAWLAAPIELSGHIGGTLSEPQLQQRIAGPLRGELNGKLGWWGTLHWQAVAELQPSPVSLLRGTWRPLVVAGRIEGEGDFIHNRLRGELTLRDKTLGKWRGAVSLQQQGREITIEHVRLKGIGHAATVEGGGKLRLVGSPDYVAESDLQLQWQDVVWPVSGESESWRSAEGRARVTGRLTGYRLVTELALAAPHYPDSRWQLDADGDLHHLASRTLRLQGLDGSAEGEASLVWSPQLEWHAHLRGKRLDPAVAWPQWPGRLDIDISSNGVWGDSQRFDVAVSALQGQLRERRFSGNGRLDYRDGQWQLDNLQLAYGTARFAAAGGIATPWALRWRLDAPQLGQLLPDARGALQLSGELRGERDTPRITLSGDGSELRWEQWRVQHSNIEADLDFAALVPWQLHLQLKGVRRGEQVLAESVQLQGEGNADLHHLALRSESELGLMQLALDGVYRAGEWQGVVRDGELRSNEQESWRQEAAATLSVSANRTTLTPFCWGSGGARGCVELRPAQEGGSELLTSLDGLPVAPFSRWLGRNDITFGGTLVAEGRLLINGGLQQARFDAHLDGGELHYRHPLDRTIDLLFREFSVALQSDARGSRARFAVALDNGDTMQLEASLPDWLPGRPLYRDQEVSGSAQLSMRDLEWLSIVVPEILEPRGTISAQLALGGIVADPRLTGTLAVSDGSVVIPRAGVTLRQIGIAASSPDGVSLRLSGAARSGPGWVTLEGELLGESLKEWRSELLLRGERFEVVRLPSVHLLASPAVRVVIEPRHIDLNGVLLVPEADIRLPELPTAVRTSSDVVLVGQTEEETLLSRWKIGSRLTLQLGDYIRVEGYGFKGRVAGQLTINEQPDEVATGQGELTVHDGRYKAYGQDLTIEYGRMLFANSLLDDPGLDVRASRTKDEVKVGVNITGRLQRPELRLFSEPAMEESDALAYLVLGRPLRTASSSEATSVSAAATSLGLVGGERIARVVGSEFGIDDVSLGTEYGAQDTALLLGKYLSPRLYVQYAVVFSSALNVTRLRYELTNHWYIKAESGEQQSADILYTFER